MRFWWDCWPCLWCAKHVCNQPVAAKGSTVPCYSKHLAEHHPSVYERKT
jgi:hypothetical protein